MQDEKLKIVFDQLDDNLDGKISAYELGLIFDNNSEFMSKEWDNIIAEVNK